MLCTQIHTKLQVSERVKQVQARQRRRPQRQQPLCMHASGLQRCLTAWLRASSQRSSPSRSTLSSRHAALPGCKLPTDDHACDRKLIHTGIVCVVCCTLALDW